MIITGKKAIDRAMLVNLGDKAIQMQSVGVDLRVKRIFEWASPGVIDFDNKKRKLALLDEISWKKGKIHLDKGSYFVEFEESITVPLNSVGFLYPRSTLMRCGVVLNSSLFDPGYSGSIASILYVGNPHGLNIVRGARIAQCIFVRTEKRLKNGYKGVYQNKPIK